MRTNSRWHWLDEWLCAVVHPSARLRLSETLRHERFLVAGIIAALLSVVTLPLALLAEAPASILAVWSGLILTPLAATFLLTRSGRVDLSQAIHAAALSIFVVICANALNLGDAALCLALLAVPLEAAAAGSRRGFVAACASGIVAFAIAPQVGKAVSLPVPLFCATMVAAIVIVAQVLARIVMAEKLDRLVSRAPPEVIAAQQETLNALDDLVTWHDSDGTILRSNGASTKLLGAPASAIHGSGLFTRILVSDRPAFLTAVSDAARGATTAVVQFRLKTDEGDARNGFIWVEMRVHGVHLSNDLACAAVAVTRDISAHRRHAEERDALRREAVRANDARAELLATVSHELRAPLNAILGYSEILMGRGNLVLLERRESYAELIHQSGEHMLGIVDTMLDLSSIEAGHYGLAFEPVALATVVREACAVVALRAEQTGVSVIVDLQPDLPDIIADSRACRQILLNLLANAVKFTPREGEVRIEALRDAEGVAICIRDTSMGVSDHDLSRLGVPFFRGASGYLGDDKGNGLGLSVVRGLVALHRGRISFGNAPKSGTVVKLYLPIDGQRDTAIDNAADARAPLALPATSDMIVRKTG